MSEPNKLQDIYKRLKPHVEELSIASLAHDSTYQFSLKAALIKNYEFNSFVTRQSSEENSFLYTATLRGLCEDIIALKFLQSFDGDDASQIVKDLMRLNVIDGVNVQTEFFRLNRPSQPILNKNTFKISARDIVQEQSAIEKRIADLQTKYGWTPKRKKELPSIREMAKVGGLLSLYEYMYAATSKWVHFNPQILLRMGWGNSDNPQNTNFTFSTEQFNKYYFAFNQIYGTYLFVTFYNSFKENLNFLDEFTSMVDELRNHIDGIPRLPELVTFEEMNYQSISPLMYLISHLAAKTEKE